MGQKLSFMQTLAYYLHQSVTDFTDLYYFHKVVLVSRHSWCSGMLSNHALYYQFSTECASEALKSDLW